MGGGGVRQKIKGRGIKGQGSSLLELYSTASLHKALSVAIGWTLFMCECNVLISSFAGCYTVYTFTERTS